MERTEKILDELRDVRARVDRITVRLDELKRICDQLPPLKGRKQTVQQIKTFFEKLQNHSLPRVVKIINKLDKESDEWIKKLKKV